MLQTLFFLVSLTKIFGTNLTRCYTVTLPLESWQARRALLPDSPNSNINSIATTASNASDNGQTNASSISIARSDPTASTNLQRSSNKSYGERDSISTCDRW